VLVRDDRETLHALHAMKRQQQQQKRMCVSGGVVVEDDGGPFTHFML
jgi:hypothetical protein